MTRTGRPILYRLFRRSLRFVLCGRTIISRARLIEREKRRIIRMLNRKGPRTNTNDTQLLKYVMFKRLIAATMSPTEIEVMNFLADSRKTQIIYAQQEVLEKKLYKAVVFKEILSQVVERRKDRRIANLEILYLNLTNTKIEGETDFRGILRATSTKLRLTKDNLAHKVALERILQQTRALIHMSSANQSANVRRPPQAQLSGAVLSGAARSGAERSEAARSGAALSGAALSGAALSGDALSGSALSGAAISGAVLSGAARSGAERSEAARSGAALSGAALSGAALSGAALSGVALSGAALSGAVLSGTAPSRAALSGAALSGAALSGAAPSRAALSGAALSGAALSGARLSRVERLKMSIASDRKQAKKDMLPPRKMTKSERDDLDYRLEKAYTIKDMLSYIIAGHNPGEKHKIIDFLCGGRDKVKMVRPKTPKKFKIPARAIERDDYSSSSNSEETSDEDDD